MVRRRIVERISVLGVNPLRGDPSGDGDIRLDTGDQPVAVLRIEAREDLVIAADTAAMIGLGTVTDRDIPRDGG
jgi:acetate kinase